MELKKEYKLYLAGVWVEGEKLIDIINPFDNKLVAKAHSASTSQVRKAIETATEVFPTFRKFPPYKRRDALLKIAQGLKDNLEFHAETLAKESGKSLADSRIEIERGISTLTISAEEATRIGGEVMPLDISKYGEGRDAIIKRFPIGPVAGISPFNFPLNLGLHKIAPAIASGNPIVHKPASKTPLSLLLLAELIDKTDIPKGAVSILVTSRDAATPLVEDSRIKLLSFTGSPGVGWNMKARAGKKKVVLELGGNAGAIVDNDADIKHAAERIALGAFSYQGQVCISVQRALIHKDLYQEFSQALIKEVKKLKIGDPIDPGTDFGPMIDEKNAKRIEKWVNESVKGGARIIYGGKRDGGNYEPTIIEKADPKDKIVCIEAFGPILTLEPFNDINDAFKKINDSVYGLQVGIFTDSIKNSYHAFEDLDVGGVIINDVPTFRVDNYPYGGIKESGFGREGVRYAIEDMTELKAMIIKR